MALRRENPPTAVERRRRGWDDESIRGEAANEADREGGEQETAIIEFG